MASRLPPELRELASVQRGVLSRSQLLTAGLTVDVARARLRRGDWQRLYVGVYAGFSGETSRSAALWAAVLYAGPGAMLSHQTAAELQGLMDTPSSLIHLTVPGERRVRKAAGLVIHLSARASEAVHPVRTPPQTRVEETIIDLWESARNLDDAVGWLTRGVGRRLTTQDRLHATQAARNRVRWRRELTELLSPSLAGVHSVLEYRYVRDVERPHGLPSARRQVKVRRGGHAEYLDLLYEEYDTVVELDGSVAHPGDTRWRDIRRDNAAAAEGKATLRYGYMPISATPCEVAVEVTGVLALRGFRDARRCSPGCPIGPVLQQDRRTSA